MTCAGSAASVTLTPSKYQLPVAYCPAPPLAQSCEPSTGGGGGAFVVRPEIFEYSLSRVASKARTRNQYFLLACKPNELYSVTLAATTSICAKFLSSLLRSIL